ncbi:MAG: hypothetical protein ACRDT6_11725 [Micromonosporaceae bacterium]
MPFTVIAGQYRLVGKTRAGNPSGFSPDGDSIQFQPDDRGLLEKLPVLDRPIRFTSVGSVQLRMEGIDALELHFTQPGGRTHQPRPLADESRDALIETLGLGPVTYQEPDGTRVRPPAPGDGRRGWILTRALDVHGRPVSWVSTGEPPAADGSEVWLDDPLLRRTANYTQVAAGAAYPLFYDTLFADLRQGLADAAVAAEEAKRGIWARDVTMSGVDGGSVRALQRDGVIFPKLFRRLAEYHATQSHDLDGFLPWLQQLGEQVIDLDTTNFTHFDNVVAVDGDQVRLTRPPVRLVFVSDKGRRRPNRPPR